MTGYVLGLAIVMSTILPAMAFAMNAFHKMILRKADQVRASAPRMEGVLEVRENETADAKFYKFVFRSDAGGNSTPVY